MLYLLFNTILRTILSFLLGCMPNITRNAIVNCAELVTYDMIKELILKYDLMTGEVQQNNSQTADISPISYTSGIIYELLWNDVTWLLFPYRQPAVPLHCRLRCRLLHNSSGFSCGCSQNTVHEFRVWPVQQR